MVLGGNVFRLLTGAAATLLPALAWASGGEGGGLGDVLPVWSIIPFAGLLLSIAIMPMVAEHFWHKNRNQLLVAMGWATPVLAYLLWLIFTDHGTLGHDASHSLSHALEEYVSFMALLGSLYTISGGILLRGDLRATPLINTTFLAVGAVLANFIGTTGASMLLIRPMLRTNSERTNTWHTPLFFIFIVSNVGGALTPIGDPPLFLGYLRGVDFFWTVWHLGPIWVPTIITLLVMYFAVDTWQFRREEKAAVTRDIAQIEPLGLDGKINFLLLVGVVACVLLLSPDPEVHDLRHYYLRELGMAGLAVVSVMATPRSVRHRNAFNWSPILEVAALFIGIFIAMIPATALLQAHGSELGITEAWQYFWATGALSAFLDNAPTYVTFAAMACGTDPTCVSAENLAPLSTGEFSHVLVAISLGAVFMGAGSYIGNGPNFMVRSIAEQAGYKMPSFFGYVAYAAVFLGPVFIAVTLLALL